jgi:hypothetical protein
MATALKVTVVPERISLRPGESADVELTVQNASQVVEHFAATVVGLPSNDLFSCEPEVVKLRPREVGTLRVKVQVPERGGLVAGPYTLGLVVKSPYSQEVSRCEELPLDVQPAPALSMSVQPEVATGGKVGHYGVNLSNDGNMPMAVTLSGTDPENRVGFKFEPREIRLEPGMAAGANISVNSDPPLTGQDIRRSVTLRAHAGETTVDKPLTFVQRPRIRGGMMKFGALAAGLAVLGGMTYGGAKLLRDLKTENTAQTSQLPPQTNGQQNPTEAKNDQNGQSQPPQTTAPTTSSQQQQSSQQNPASQSSAPSGAAAAQQVPTVDVIDFTLGPDNKPASSNFPIDGKRYSDQGLSLANVLERAPIGCEDATQQWIRISRAGTTNGNPVAGAGVYLTSGRPTEIRDCNVVPIRMTFDQPLRAVNVFFTALPGVKYTATITFADGNKTSLEAAGTQIGQDVPIGFQVPKNGQPIKAVEFGHSATVQDAPQSIVMLKRVGYTRAQ